MPSPIITSVSDLFKIDPGPLSSHPFGSLEKPTLIFEDASLSAFTHRVRVKADSAITETIHTPRVY